MALLEQLYGASVEVGLLFYSSNSAVVGVRRNSRHLASLIQVSSVFSSLCFSECFQHRNAIAYYLSHPKMPPMKKVPHFCGSCSSEPVCTLVHRAVEGGTAEVS